MNERDVHNLLSGSRRGAGATLLRTGLWAASKPYAAAMRLRRWAYRRRCLHSAAASIPVICVGNLTTGGTGKTPMVAWVVARLKEMGRTPAILTRGYKAVEGVSDEAELLQRLCDSPVIVNADRVAGAARAAEQGADVVVMDDGYQHRRLQRDLDIVLVDATQPFGYEHCLPRGLLREPVSALRDASAVVITRSDEVDAHALAGMKTQLARLAPQASLHGAAHLPTGLIDETGALQPTDALAGRCVVAFCGLGNPSGFFAALRRLGAIVADELAFDDHTAYGPAEVAEIARATRGSDAEILVTTQKDFVKLQVAEPPRPIWQLAVAMDVRDGRADLIDALCGALAASPRQNTGG